MPGPPPPSRRPAVAVVAVAVLLVAAAVASADSARQRGDDGHVRLPALGAVADLLVVATVLAGSAVVLVVLLVAGERRRRAPGRDLAWIAQVAVMIVLAALLFGLPRLRPAEDDDRRPPEADAALDGGAIEAPPAASAADVALVLVVLAVGMVVTVAAASAGRSRRSRRQAGGAGETAAAALSDLLDETADDLAAAPDPRRAVIAAFARMERLLADHGLPRRPAEAPGEYLGRCLADLDAVGPAVTRLTGLFQEAMFSRHPVSGQMRDDAVGALRAVRDELRVTA